MRRTRVPFSRAVDPDKKRAEFLRAAIASDDRSMEELRATRAQMTRELGDPDQVRSERGALELEHGRCRREFDDLVNSCAARELAAEPSWASDALGHRPGPGRTREAWDGAVHHIARYRLEYEVDAVDSAVGPEPSDQPQRRGWVRAQQALERGQRVLGVSIPERVYGRDRDMG